MTYTSPKFAPLRRLRDGVRACLAALAAVAAFVTPASADERGAQKPNILFIIADDWSYPHSGVDGMTVVKTPAIDRIAREGAHFTRAFVPAPSCSPCRASIITGQTPNRLDGGNRLSGPLPDEHPRYPDLLADAGYHVGHSGKGYGPAWLDENKIAKAGEQFPSFDAFLKRRGDGEPFAFWFGSQNPHRPYLSQVTRARGVSGDAVPVPGFLVDTPETREDLAHYYAEIAELDDEVADLMRLLEATGEADNTLIVIASDNGMPFARAKANLYDYGTRSPMMVRWPARVEAGQEIDAFVNLADLAPTFLEAAGVDVPDAMNAPSILSLITDADEPDIGEGMSVMPGREGIFLIRDQHVPFNDRTIYASRAVRTGDYLYILNLFPDNWPAGPPNQKNNQFPSGFPDVDEANAPNNPQQRGGGSKGDVVKAFEAGDQVGVLALGKRPAEELYRVNDDPENMNNLADDPEYAEVKRELAGTLRAWMVASDDERADELSGVGEGQTRAE